LLWFVVKIANKINMKEIEVVSLFLKLIVFIVNFNL